MVTSHKKRAIGVFSKPEDLEQAVNELKASGFAADNISVIAKHAGDEDRVGDVKVSDRIGDAKVETATGVLADTAYTSANITVFAGLTSLALPGIGPILAAGSLATSLVATVAGTGASAIAANHLVNAFAQLGIPKEQASVYGDRLHNGNYLVIVEGADDQIQQAQTLLGDRDIQDWSVFDAPVGG